MTHVWSSVSLPAVLASRFKASFTPSQPITARLLRTEVLSGLVVALALVPEAISFSIIAGVDPRIGLFASFTMAVVDLRGRRAVAMISAATGAIALVVAPLAREYGLGYLVATVILGGVFQVVLGSLGVARLMRFVPRSRDGRVRQLPGHSDLHGAGAGAAPACPGPSIRWSPGRSR